MDVTFIYKWSYDPTDALVYDDGTYKWRQAKLVAHDDEAQAIVCARAIASGENDTITAITIGNGDVSWAAARGATRTIRAKDVNPSDFDARTGYLLAQIVKAAGHSDVILMGNILELSGVAGTLAAYLDIPLVAGVSDVALDPDDEHCLIAQRQNGNVNETLRLHTPVLVTVAAAGTETNIPGIKQMLAARKLPVDELEVDNLDISEDTGVNLSVTSVRTPTQRVARIFEGDLPQAVNELIATLRAEGTLE